MSNQVWSITFRIRFFDRIVWRFPIIFSANWTFLFLGIFENFFLEFLGIFFIGLFFVFSTAAETRPAFNGWLFSASTVSVPSATPAPSRPPTHKGISAKRALSSRKWTVVSPFGERAWKTPSRSPTQRPRPVGRTVGRSTVAVAPCRSSPSPTPTRRSRATRPGVIRWVSTATTRPTRRRVDRGPGDRGIPAQRRHSRRVGRKICRICPRRRIWWWNWVRRWRMPRRPMWCTGRLCSMGRNAPSARTRRRGIPMSPTRRFSVTALSRRHSPDRNSKIHKKWWRQAFFDFD